MKNILIIGCKGFIGQHCLNHFEVNQNTTVFGCDVVVDYVSENYFLIGTSNSDFDEMFKGQQFDVCINCSGAASVPDSVENPRRDFELNTVNVFKILDAIRKYNPECKFINLSSAAVYGNPRRLPISETDNVSPISPYGFHKLQSEQICREMSNIYGLKTTSLRIFSAYGNGLFKQLFWDLHQKSISKEKIKLWGTGNESRDFIHVDDIVQVIKLITLSDNFEHTVINVANGHEVFIKDVVDLFYSLIDKKIEYSFEGEVRKGDPTNWVADITTLKSMGYKQTVPLNEGVKKYIAWLTA